ncbi:MAG TPA: recombinase family protein [Streptosporangiaceae bacterium]|jgi:DNA invertase Pin-like site-specific DNA recombinase
MRTTTKARSDGKIGTVRAAVYVRISSDREGAGLGVARQEEDCRALCERLGWQVADIYPDNDVSAYSGKKRPEWERLNSDIRDGTVDAIACWHVDRLTRSPRELEDVIDLHDMHGIQLATCTGEIDLSTPTGRFIARALGAAARHEAEHKAERQRRQRRQSAQAGTYNGGQRGYGHTLDRSQIIEAEAEVIREYARRALAGESLNEMAAAMTAQGMVTSTGRPWTRSALKTVLIAARISGRREYRPTDSYEHGHRPLTGEITATGCWPAIISEDDSDRLRALLTAPGRNTNPGRRSYRYLLTGIFACGRCGTPMVGRPHAGGRARIICKKEPGKPGCGRMTVFADLAETEARDRILTVLEHSPGMLERMLAKHQAQAAGPAGEDPATELRKIEEKRNELATDWANEEVTRKEWVTAKRVLDERAAALSTRINRTAQARALSQFAALDGDMWQRWEHPSMTSSGHRALIQACVTRIIVQPASNGSRWDPDRIQPEWIA